MSDGIFIVNADSDPSSLTWFQLPYYRWATLEGTTTEPPVLQVAWQSGSGELKWCRIETVVVSREDYDRT